jgi:hypothetical protein
MCRSFVELACKWMYVPVRTIKTLYPFRDFHLSSDVDVSIVATDTAPSESWTPNGCNMTIKLHCIASNHYHILITPIRFEAQKMVEWNDNVFEWNQKPKTVNTTRYNHDSTYQQQISAINVTSMCCFVAVYAF